MKYWSCRSLSTKHAFICFRVSGFYGFFQDSLRVWALVLAHGGISDAGQQYVFRKTHARLPVFRDGPILTGGSYKDFLGVFVIFSGKVGRSYMLYGCSDEQCSTPRARCVWCWGGVGGGVGCDNCKRCSCFKKNVKRSRRWGVALHPCAFLSFCFRFVSPQICCASLTLKVIICIYYLARKVSFLRQGSGLSRKFILRWVMRLFRWLGGGLMTFVVDCKQRWCLLWIMHLFRWWGVRGWPGLMTFIVDCKQR